MTEVEAEVFAARLTRIWAPGQEHNTHVTWGRDYDSDLYLEIPVADMVILGVQFQRNGLLYTLIERKNDDVRAGLVCHSQEIYHGYLDTEWMFNPNDQREFVTPWLPLFRRGCWLCGCDIEATGHEKAEWIQRFTKEEIEAWNLKM